MTSAVCFCILAVLCVAVKPFPSNQQRMYSHATQEHINPLNSYYLDGQDSYYGAEQKQGEHHATNGASARLETLEPDSEVELVPGVQQPQQPQQPPVAPHIPGLLPGQRVFIIHMPIPGYRPGTIGGYQPVYIVGAGPQGNPGFPGNGFQNAVFFDQSGQAVSPGVGYQKGAVLAPQHNSGLILGGPLALTRPLDFGYQEYPNSGAQILQAVDGIRSIQLAQQIGLQNPGPQGHAAPVPSAHQVNGAGAPNDGESEALLGPKDTQQGIKEIDTPKLKSRTPGSIRKA